MTESDIRSGNMASFKFESNDLEILRGDLLKYTLDPLQVAELFQVFLTDKGYGVSLANAVETACRVGRSGCSPITLQRELDGLALAM
jgi:hypothetical protein